MYSHLDAIFVKINGERFYIWRGIDHEGELLESFVTKRRDKAAAKKFIIKTLRKHGSPKIITTDKLSSYRTAFRELGVVNHEKEPFRGREWTMQKFTSNHAQIYNHFIYERHLETRRSFKLKRATVLREWFNFCLA